VDDENVSGRQQEIVFERKVVDQHDVRRVLYERRNERDDRAAICLRDEPLRVHFEHALVFPQLVHLGINGESIALHKIGLSESENNREVRCMECNQPLRDQLLYQVFVAVRDSDDSCLLFLPPGNLSVYKFPRAFQLILGKLPSGNTSVASVCRPARLKKTGDQLNYQVDVAMRLEYGDHALTVEKPGQTVMVPETGC